MLLAFTRLPVTPAASRWRVAAPRCALLALSLAAGAQQPGTPQLPVPASTAPDAAQTPAQPAPTQGAPAQPQEPATATSTDVQQAPATATQPSAAAGPAHPSSIGEEELKQMLVGKQIYLRGGYLGDNQAQRDPRPDCVNCSNQFRITNKSKKFKKLLLPRRLQTLEASA